MTNKIGSLAFVIAITSLSACGTKLDASSVPAAVKTNFDKAHPTAKAKWEKEDNNYEVNFSVNGREMSRLYSADGSLMESEASIDVADLPANAQSYISKNFPGKKVKEAARITKADGTINFEAEVNGADHIFDASGNFLKTVKE